MSKQAWVTQARQRLATDEAQYRLDLTNGTAIKMPANPWPYTVEFSPDNPNIRQGLARWVWLCDNVGEYRQAWNIIPAYSPDENVVYMFQHQEDAARFTLTWL